MNLSPFFGHPFAVQFHLVAALLALVLGAVQLIRRKGTPSHRAIGYVWVVLMLAVALSSFWITGIADPGQFSVIHALSVFTLAMLALSIWAIRRGNVRTHRFSMIGVYAGGLIGAGAGAFAPGRLMSQILGYA
jgi:uncharacterized membrane protein